MSQEHLEADKNVVLSADDEHKFQLGKQMHGEKVIMTSRCLILKYSGKARRFTSRILPKAERATTRLAKRSRSIKSKPLPLTEKDGLVEHLL